MENKEILDAEIFKAMRKALREFTDFDSLTQENVKKESGFASGRWGLTCAGVLFKYLWDGILIEKGKADLISEWPTPPTPESIE